jgi:hypothetical protein
MLHPNFVKIEGKVAPVLVLVSPHEVAWGNEE